MSSDKATQADGNAGRPTPAEITVGIGDQSYRLTYEKAFAFGCSLLEQGRLADAAALFERLEEFADRGPRAFIMQAFCEAAALHFDDCSKPLNTAFEGANQETANSLHNAFVSYHVGIREDAIKSMIELVNEHRDLPTLCLLLGDMLAAASQIPMARNCWSMAVKRDRQNGAVAGVARSRLQRAAEKSSDNDGTSEATSG